MKSLLDILPPEVKNNIRKHGLWTYRIDGPVSLDDLPETVVIITYGRKRAITTARYVLEFK